MNYSRVRSVHLLQARFLSTTPYIAIVGAGPAGFYTAHRLLKGNPNVYVHLFEKLPAPYGLVRYGVAPDHPEVKNVIHKFNEVAQSSRFTYFGNVPIGDLVPGGVPISALTSRGYASVILATGATSSDNVLGIPGEKELDNIFSARTFVGWYNGLPGYANLSVNLTADPNTALIFGQGNVALDIARILLTPVDFLRNTDIAPYALEALSHSKIRNVRIIGRRGPLQVAFTAKELRELLSLPSTQFKIDKQLLLSQLQSHASILADDRPRKRLMTILEKASSFPLHTDNAQLTQSWCLDFLKTPSQFVSSHVAPNRVGAAILTENNLVLQSSSSSPCIGHVTARPKETDDMTTVVPTSLVIKSIGYRATPIDTAIPFDSTTATVPHNGNGYVSDRLFVCGWLKRGPVGVIASTMHDAYHTAQVTLDSLSSIDSNECAAIDKNEIKHWLYQTYGHIPVDWNGWLKIQKYEQEQLNGHKVIDIDDMLRIASE